MKYYGKEKCRILKEIRAEIARQNDIEWVVSECKHQGNCRGTCPKCEAEVRELETALARREALGKKVAVVGISAGIALSVTGCANPIGTLGGKPLDDGATAGRNPAAADTAAPTETQAVLDGEMVEMGEPLPPPESETEPVLMGDDILLPTMGDPVMEEDTDAYDIPTAGVPMPGEVPEETIPTDKSDTDTDDAEEDFMGEPAL